MSDMIVKSITYALIVGFLFWAGHIYQKNEQRAFEACQVNYSKDTCIRSMYR